MKKLLVKVSNPKFKVHIDLPNSKSISNRLLIIRALSTEYFGIKNLSKAHDTVLLTKLLDQILSIDSSNQINELDAEDAGTVFRFLTALLSSIPGTHLLTGHDRMKERPIHILVEALKSLGANIQYAEKEGFPPLLIKGQRLKSKSIIIDSNISSQYISALLMIGPRLPEGLTLNLKNDIASEPYLDMTIELMRKFGIEITRDNREIKVKNGFYRSNNMVVERDWSSAAFWYEAVALSENGSLILNDLDFSSLQGDSQLVEIYDLLGVSTQKVENGILIKQDRPYEKNFSYDFSSCPDLAMPVIATCAGLGIIGRFSGLESLKIKESNRIAALEVELGKLVFDFRETDSNEWVLINSCSSSVCDYDFRDIKIETYNDHRIAMSFAPLSIIGKGITIDNPDVVSKSYPGFWKEFDKLSD